jgi:hypothetical protein
MAQPTYGTHRVKNPGLEDGVWITDGKNGFEITESRYRENGYKPRVVAVAERNNLAMLPAAPTARASLLKPAS